MASITTRNLDDVKRRLPVRAVERPVSVFDCQIVAITRSCGIAMATLNTDVFEGCGVEIVDPWCHEGAD